MGSVRMLSLDLDRGRESIESIEDARWEVRRSIEDELLGLMSLCSSRDLRLGSSLVLIMDTDMGIMDQQQRECRERRRGLIWRCRRVMGRESR